jgi:hypothetical protein
VVNIWEADDDDNNNIADDNVVCVISEHVSDFAECL